MNSCKNTSTKNIGPKTPTFETPLWTKSMDILQSINIGIDEIVCDKLSENEISNIMTLTNTWFWIQLSEEDIKNHLFKSDKIFLLKDREKIIWFSSIIFLEWLVYRFGSVIDSSYQKQWIYSHFNSYISGEEGFLRTQNHNIIKSLNKAWYQTYLWEIAYGHILQRVEKEKIDLFFASLDNWTSTFSKGVFKKAYWSPMWTEETVNFISHEIYPHFNHKEWDALLVFYHK